MGLRLIKFCPILEGMEGEGGPSGLPSCIAVTGTIGKTTVSSLFRSIMVASGNRVGLMNVTCLAELYGRLRQMRTAGISHVVIEVSPKALLQQRIEGIDFKAAIFTDLNQEHFDCQEDIEAYREANKLLFRNLSPGAVAVLNAGDPTSHYLARQTRARLLWYHPNATNRIKGEVLTTSPEGTELMLSDGNEELLVKSPLVGMHNFSNLLAAATAAKALGVGLLDIKNGIESLECLPGRLERIPGRGFQVFIDYARTPQALEAALESLRPLVENRLLLVFGCGGKRDKGKMPLLGQVAERHSDLFWLTSDSPHSEPPMQIIQEIEKGISGRSYRIEPDRRLAIEQALSHATRGDVLLIAGEQTQDIGGLFISFNDRDIVMRALSRKTPWEKRWRISACRTFGN